jgi:hypothetical protein
MKCKNENCLLNKKKKCISDIVINGIAPCDGKDRVSVKTTNKRWGNSNVKTK